MFAPSEASRRHKVHPGQSDDQSYLLLPTYNISISEFFSNVNKADGDFVKYIPDGFLTSEQKESKKIAIEKERVYIQEKNQRKYNNRVDSQKPEGKASLKILGEEYSYDSLVSKNDMPITYMEDIDNNTVKRYQRDTVTFGKDMMEIASEFEANPRNTDTSTYIHCDDLSRDILIGRNSFKHSAARMDKTYVQTCMNLGDILKNAVALNELEAREQGMENANVLIGIAENEDSYVFVRLIVDHRQWKLENFDFLYAINKSKIKKEDVGIKPQAFTAQGDVSRTSSTISIAHLLENVKNQDLFREVISEDVAENKNTPDESEAANAKHMLKESVITTENIETLRSIGRKSVNKFTSEDMKKAEPFARRAWEELGTKSPFFRAWFGDWRANDNTPVKIEIVKQDFRGSVKNNDTGWDIIVSRHIHKETNAHRGSYEVNALKYLPYIKSITENAILFNASVSNKDNKLSVMYYDFYAYTETLGYPALLRLRVEELANEKNGEPIRRDYILQNIEEESVSIGERFSKAHHQETNSSTISISDLFKLVNTYDKKFNPKEPSKVVNADGSPKVMYHGTNADENFTDGTQNTLHMVVSANEVTSNIKRTGVVM